METVQILGRRGCGTCVFTTKAFELARIPHQVIDVDRDPAAAAIARTIAGELGATQLPVVICPDGTRWAGLQLDRIATQIRLTHTDLIATIRPAGARRAPDVDL